MALHARMEIPMGTLQLDGLSLPIFHFNTVVVGTGCAGYNAADTLCSLGVTDIAIVTEGICMGTSRNTGSDKQTYYKLTSAGSQPDSVHDMARTLFDGGSMHGDIALVEAALSSRAFYKLVDIGVPFPHNRYGEYTGYKTDHDPRQRATSCGPLTSRFMTERLQARVERKGVPVFDGFRVVSILTDGLPADRSIGLVAIDMDGYNERTFGLTLFNCTNIIYAVGGPSGMYASSVYPESQTCATGIALEAGARGVNLTESQYGIASTRFRWNLSGSYQQVIPTYISTEQDGEDGREFLDDYFEDPRALVEAVFLKGYQWPFDPRKLGKGGSSLVDLAVFAETRLKGRRVFLDFRANPTRAGGMEGLKPEVLRGVAREYLERSRATGGAPIERLLAMNAPAYELFRSNGIDLKTERLEIDVCAQHNNGGLLGNCWWESNLRHFFPVGEVNGTFGVYRPGGAALNSTQVGSTRAAQYIAAHYGQPPLPAEAFALIAAPKLQKVLSTARALSAENGKGGSAPLRLRAGYQRRMDVCGALIRPLEKVQVAIEGCVRDLASFERTTRAKGAAEMVAAFVNRDILLAQFAYLSAIAEYICRGGGSRGSYLVGDVEGGALSEHIRMEGFPVNLDDGALSKEVCEVELKAEEPSCLFEWRPVRPIPSDYDDWFENVYNAFLQGAVIG